MSPGADLGLELDLHRLEEAFDQPARRRIARGPVQEFDVQRITGGLQGVGVVDLGIVQVQFAAGSVGRPGPQQRIDEDVQRLPEVVPRRDDVAAVTVDESRQVRANRLAFVEHVGAFLEITQPKFVGLLAGPAAADLDPGDPQFQPRGPGLLQVAIQRGLGDLLAELQLQELVDRLVGTEGLFRLQFDGPLEDLRRVLARLAAIAAPLASQGLEAPLLKGPPLAPQRADRDFPTLAVRKHVLSRGDFAQAAQSISVLGLAFDQRP